MEESLLKKRYWNNLILFTGLLFSTLTFGQTVALDQADLDYAPGETVYITGTGWQPNEVINLRIDHLTEPIPDHGTPNPHLPWTIAADNSGNFDASWFVTEYELGSDLLLIAEGSESGSTYEVFFTDGTWTISSNSTNLCLNQSKELTITLTTTGTPNNSSFSVNFPASFALSGLSITSVTGNKTWASSLSGSTVCLTRTGGGSNALQSGDSIIFKVTVLASTTSGSPFSITGLSSNGTTPCPASGTAQTTALSISVNNIILNSSAVHVACNGGATGSIDLTPSGGATPYTYVWTASGGGAIPSGQSINQDLSGLVAGNYSVTVTDNNGCTSGLSNIQITQPAAALSASETHVNVSCFGGSNGSINLSPSGGTTPYTYAWTGAGVNATAEDQSGLSAGSYNVTVTDSKGCTFSLTNIQITQPAAALSASETHVNISCFGGSNGSINLTPSGGTAPYTFAWTGTGVNATAEDQSGLSAGSYNVTVTDSKGCTFSLTNIQITQPAAALSASETHVNVSCFGGSNGSINLSPSGGTTPYTYAWTGAGVNATAEDQSGLSAGSYDVTVTDNKGCTFTLSNIQITEPIEVTVSASKTNVSCNGAADGTITVSGVSAGASTIIQLNGLGADLSGQSTFAPGTYVVTASAPNGNANGYCTATASVTISEPAQLTASKTEGTIACHGGSTSVNITASGGTQPYTNDGAHTVSAGPYSFTVTDANGCSVVVNGTISQPSALWGTCTSNNNVLYFGYSGDQTSTITVKPYDGVGPYKVSITMNRPLRCNAVNSSGDEVWTPGANTASSSNIGCPTSGTPSLDPVSTSLCNITTENGYSLNVTLLESATFTATITDKNGCTRSYSTVISAEDVRCFAGNSGVPKVYLCHKTGSTKNPCINICVDQSAVAEHLAHGDFFGKCTSNCINPNATPVKPVDDGDVTLFDVKAYPNPSNSQFTFEVESNSDEKVVISVFDVAGRIVKKIEKEGKKPIQFGDELPRGVYLAVVEQGTNQKTIRIVKE